MNYRTSQLRQMWKNDLASKNQQWTQERNILEHDLTTLQNSVDVTIVENLTKENKNQAKQITALTLLATQRKAELEQEKTALINLARQKIQGKKEAQELLNQIETNWNQDRDTWEREREELSEQLTESQNDYQTTFKKLTKSTEQLAGHQTFSKNFLEMLGYPSFEALEKAVKELRQENQNLTNNLEKTQQAWEKDNTTWQEKANQWQTEENTYQQQIKETTKQLQEKSTTYIDLSLEHKNLTKTHEDLKGETHQLTENLKQKAQENQNQQTQIKNLEKQLQQSQERETNLNKTIQQKDREHQFQEERLQNFKTKNQEKDRELTQKQTQLNNLQKEKGELQGKITEKDQALNEKNTKLAQQKQVLEQLLANREERLEEVEND